VTYTATTNANGFFQSTGLLPGTYTLSITPPSGFTNSSDQAGTVNASGTASSGTIGNINLGPGGVGINYDFQEAFFGGGSS